MPDKSRAIIDEMASYLADREGRMAGAEGLRSTDLIQVFALAAVEAVMRVENLDKAYAEELGTMAVMCLVERSGSKGRSPQIQSSDTDRSQLLRRGGVCRQ